MAQIKTGRPKSDNPKSKPIHVRLDNHDMKILDDYSDRENITRTEAIRRGIRLLESRTIK